MERHHRVFAIAAFLIVAASIAYLAIAHNREVGSTSVPNLPREQYVNTTYGFSLEYPPQYHLNEYTNRDIALQDPESGEAIAVVDVQLSDPASDKENYQDFIHEAAQRTCEADGPLGTIGCTGVSRSEIFTSAHGVRGDVFYLTHRTVTVGATTTREAGPYYAFDISEGSPERAHAAVLIRIGHPAEESDLYAAGASLAQTIAENFRIIAASRD